MDRVPVLFLRAGSLFAGLRPLLFFRRRTVKGR